MSTLNLDFTQFLISSKIKTASSSTIDFIKIFIPPFPYYVYLELTYNIAVISIAHNDTLYIESISALIRTCIRDVVVAGELGLDGVQVITAVADHAL